VKFNQITHFVPLSLYNRSTHVVVSYKSHMSKPKPSQLTLNSFIVQWIYPCGSLLQVSQTHVVVSYKSHMSKPKPSQPTLNSSKKSMIFSLTFIIMTYTSKITLYIIYIFFFFFFFCYFKNYFYIMYIFFCLLVFVICETRLWSKKSQIYKLLKLFKNHIWSRVYQFLT
jgi:hypothetical protein